MGTRLDALIRRLDAAESRKDANVFVACRTWSGAKIHLRFEGTNVSLCGSKAPEIVKGPLDVKYLCNSCFGARPDPSRFGFSVK